MQILWCAVPQACYISFNIQRFVLSHLIRMENWCSRPGRWFFLCVTVMLVSAEGMSLSKTSHKCELLFIFSLYKKQSWPFHQKSATFESRTERVTTIYLWILLTCTGTLWSSDFHMKSSVFFTFSVNWAARTLVLSRHSASFSELRWSMLIKSTVCWMETI